MKQVLLAAATLCVVWSCGDTAVQDAPAPVVQDTVESAADTRPVSEIVRHVGPVVEENRSAFLDHRYWVELTPDNGDTLTVEGYLSDLSPEGGVWTAELSNLPGGDYRMERFFCTGDRVAITECAAPETLGVANVTLDSTDATVRVGPEGYLQTPDGKLFIKTGAGSPENILSFADFDGTKDAGGMKLSLGEDQLHYFEPHIADWRVGDPTWGDGKGKGIVGLFNYYADTGVNSQYLVGMNLHGDGQDVFPYSKAEDPYVFDLSKLAQWRTVFDHANDRGVLVHFLFTETENESFFEVHDDVEIGVDLADSRRLYYREMVARFGHLPLLIWNLGEELGIEGDTGAAPYRLPTTPEQRKKFSDELARLDARGHAIVAHTWPDMEARTHEEMLGHASFTGMSLQGHQNYFDKVVEWKQRSADAGNPWMVSVDEPLGWEFGAPPDAQAGVPRPEITKVLWPALLGGATGTEWYFGWQNNAPTSDLSNEDQRTRDALFKSSARVRGFFETLPLLEMESRREGDAMILEGAGHRVEMVGKVVTYTAPREEPKELDPYNPG